MCTEVGGRQQWSYLAGGGDSEADWGQVPPGGGAHVGGGAAKKVGCACARPRVASPPPPSHLLGLHLQNTYSKIKLRISKKQLQSTKSQARGLSEHCRLPTSPVLSDGSGELPGGPDSKIPWRG